ncbi:DUF348 domain-containing protein [Patescibacteria group bacterium]|nr:MAG: DUF348 domain-containing protein [Patescibacteria group bacterium]
MRACTHIKGLFARASGATKKLLLMVVLAFISVWPASVSQAVDTFSQSAKRVQIVVDGLPMGAVETRTETVEQLLEEMQFSLGEQDRLFPAPDSTLAYGSIIQIQHARHITLVDGKDTRKIVTIGRTVREMLTEEKIALDEDDILVPTRESALREGMKVSITRVEIREETVMKNVPFEKIVKSDDKMSWREKKVTQKGEAGEDKLLYKVVYHNGQEISRKKLSQERQKEPVTEIVTEGTYVKVGKAHLGAASWYAFTGTMSAANPWLPIGSYVRVTNMANGKSVIVRINDRGPFVPGRIIDLDKVAFQKIASLGAGVIHEIKMEEILN